MEKPVRQRTRERAPVEDLPPAEVDDSGIRTQFIREWMIQNKKTVAQMIAALDVDKSQVYRWIKGNMPRDPTLLRIAEFLDVHPPKRLLRHPLDDWMVGFFDNREKEQVDAIIQTMEKAWPRPESRDKDIKDGG